jgi:hypothetical protein
VIEKIRATFSVLDEWQETLAEPYAPQAASELATDDTDWPPVRLSQVAIMGLGSARDHLHAVRVLIEAGELFPFAQSTLIRAALVGAGQAVWVLAPDEPIERLARSRCLAAHMYAEHGKYIDVLRGLAPEPREPTEKVAAAIRERRDELAQLRDRDGQRAALNTTAMVEQAALAAFGTEALAKEVLSIWRLTSGATHGFGWALLGQAGTGQIGPPDSDGIAAFGAGGDVGRIANNYLGAYHLARQGWKLLRQRGSIE